MWIRGTDLTEEQRRIVQNAFFFRHLDRTCYPDLIVTKEGDAKWITEHAFPFVLDGSRLDGRYSFCVPLCMLDEETKGEEGGDAAIEDLDEAVVRLNLAEEEGR